MNNRTRFALLWILVSCASSAAAEEITFYNSMPEQIKLWIWNRKEKKWNPPHYIARNGQLTIDVSMPGSAYLTLYDQLDREIPIGRVNLHEMAKTSEYVSLQSLYQARGQLTGWTIENGEVVPVWEPIGVPYAWRVKPIPLKSGDAICHEEELKFVNAPHVKFSRRVYTTYYVMGQ